MKSKIVVLLSLLLIIPSACYAGTGCVKWARFANAVMTARQYGVPLASIYPQLMWYSSVEGLNPETTERIRQIVVDAYETPRYGSIVSKDFAIIEFENKVYLECFTCKVRRKANIRRLMRKRRTVQVKFY